MYYEEETAEKPEKWPANACEQILDTLCECVEEFRKNPSYKTREVLLSLTCEHDLNLNENSGLILSTPLKYVPIQRLPWVSLVMAQTDELPML